MSAEKRSISAPAVLFAKADARKEQLGYSTFSDYIQALLRADTLGGGDHLRESAPASSTLSQAEVAAIAVARQEAASYKRKKPSK